MRIINNGALAGIYATDECDFDVVNCLISGYYAGVLLENSSCRIRNCTIASCWGPETPDELPEDWPDELPTDFAGGGIMGTVNENAQGHKQIEVVQSIIAENEIGIYLAGDISIDLINCNVFGNSTDYSGLESQVTVTDCISADPLFETGPDHGYYLRAIGAGQSEDSPCIDAGCDSMDLRFIVGGTTRTDGIFDMCTTDLGYHGNISNELVGVGNINNDEYEIDDPLKLISKVDKSEIDIKSATSKDVNALFSTGPQDVLVIQETEDGFRQFQSFFQIDCSLQQQTNSDSPDNVLDASLGDLDGDGVLDLTVLQDSGASFFVNDKEGTMIFDSTKSKTLSQAVETIDFDRDGIMDILIATESGVSVQKAEDHLVYHEFQLLHSGDTEDLVLFDFDGDADADLVTVDSSGAIRFYENNRENGFYETGKPVYVHGYGKMKIQDITDDGNMDVVVEIAPGVNEVVEVSSTFGMQQLPPSGKRAIRYVLFDHLGTAKMLIDDQCEVVWPNRQELMVNELLPFGQEMAVNDSSEMSYDLNFTGKELKRDLDLNYFGARYYHSDLPRFISPDPVRGTPENPMSWNRYLYCWNDPINYFDPDGESLVLVRTIFWTIGSMVSGGMWLIAPNAVDHERTNAEVYATKAVETVKQVDEELNKLKIKAMFWMMGLMIKEIADSDNKDKSIPPASPGKLQKEKERDRVPKGIDRFDPPDAGCPEPHVHFGDGTSSTQSGKVHGKGKGYPNPSKTIRKYLEGVGWTPPPKP